MLKLNEFARSCRVSVVSCTHAAGIYLTFLCISRTPSVCRMQGGSVFDIRAQKRDKKICPRFRRTADRCGTVLTVASKMLCHGCKTEHFLDPVTVARENNAGPNDGKPGAAEAGGRRWQEQGRVDPPGARVARAVHDTGVPLAPCTPVDLGGGVYRCVSSF